MKTKPLTVPYAITPEGVAESIKARMAKRKEAEGRLVLDCPDCPKCGGPWLGWTATVHDGNSFRGPYVGLSCDVCGTIVEMDLTK